MSISITLPENARPHELAAAAQFFTALANWAENEEQASEELDHRANVASPQAIQAVNEFNASPIGRAMNLSAEESAAVAAAVTAHVHSAPQVASTIAADQFPDVPEFPSAAEAFGTAPPVPQPVITDAAAQIGIPTPPPAAPAGVQLDKHGLPWDARIHSSSKATNADGSWRKRKGLNDDAMVARVEVELRAAQSAPAAPIAPPVPQPPTLTVVPSVPFAPPPVPSVPPPAAASPSVPAVPAGSAPTTFLAFMQALGPHLASKRVTTEMVNEVLAAHQMPPGLPVLASRPDLIPSVFTGVMQKAGLAPQEPTL